MAIKSFDTAARRGESGVNNPEPITFEIDGDELTAHPPSTGQLALFIATNADGGMKTIQGMFAFLETVLDDGDFDVIREKLREGVDLGLITDIIGYLMEEWSARPTKSSSASSKSRASTGKSSTVKRPAKRKTPSSSR